MREIKFRVWDKKSKKHRKVKNLVFTADGIHDDSECYLCWAWGYNIIEKKEVLVCREYNEFILEQYTGLKDKNGVEIYEGDVVTDRFGTTWEVKFENGMFMTDYDSLVWLIQDNNPIEVIGNIHTNPELLEE